MAQEVFEIILSNNCSLNSGQFLLVPSLNVKLYYGANFALTAGL